MTVTAQENAAATAFTWSSSSTHSVNRTVLLAELQAVRPLLTEPFGPDSTQVRNLDKQAARLGRRGNTGRPRLTYGRRPDSPDSRLRTAAANSRHETRVNR
jgi:hypothetical protein